MALDSKKVAAEVAQFKKALADADRQIKLVEDAYKDVMSAEDGMAAAAKALMADISAADANVTTNIASLKAIKEAARKITGDAEMILRKCNDDNEALLSMGDTFFELDKELKKDKANKELIKKHEIAGKALERQNAAFVKTANEAGVIRATISSFDDDLRGLPAWNLATIAGIAKNMKELGDIIDKKKQFLREIEKSKNRW